MREFHREVKRREREGYIRSRRGWLVPPSSGYRVPEFWSHAPGSPTRITTGSLCNGNTPSLPFHTTSSRTTEVTSRTPPTFPTLPRPIPVVLNDQVFGSCAWRSSSRPSCHPIREGGISPDARGSDSETGSSGKGREMVEELARTYINGRRWLVHTRMFTRRSTSC